MVGTLAGDSVCDSDGLMKIGVCALLLEFVILLQST